MAKKRKGIKINPLDVVFLGGGIIASYFIYKALSGKLNSTGQGNGTGSDTGGNNTPAPTFPTIELPFAGNYNTVSKWVEGWRNYAIASCYTDCSWRYDILEQTQTKLDDVQLKQVSDGLKQSTGKNMREQMASMSWFGGPWSDNKATELYQRVQSMSL
ncbi:hypothetical protein EB118_13220 [bacterium]|nr:hypothetical protein [bacterium]NDG31014.1 hypothetical protein [bacterium]